MHNKAINLWLLLLFPAFLFSQAKDSLTKNEIPNTFFYKRVYIGINYGVSFPMGSFFK